MFLFSPPVAGAGAVPVAGAGAGAFAGAGAGAVVGGGTGAFVGAFAGAISGTAAIVVPLRCRSVAGAIPLHCGTGVMLLRRWCHCIAVPL